MKKLLTVLQFFPPAPQLPFLPGSALVDLSFLMRLARERDIREVLTNVRSARLILRFPPVSRSCFYRKKYGYILNKWKRNMEIYK